MIVPCRSMRGLAFTVAICIIPLPFVRETQLLNSKRLNAVSLRIGCTSVKSPRCEVEVPVYKNFSSKTDGNWYAIVQRLDRCKYKIIIYLYHLSDYLCIIVYGNNRASQFCVILLLTREWHVEDLSLTILLFTWTLTVNILINTKIIFVLIED